MRFHAAVIPFVACLFMPNIASAQEGQHPQVPMSFRTWQQLHSHPEQIRALSAALPIVAGKPASPPAPPLHRLINLKGLADTDAVAEIKLSNDLTSLDPFKIVRSLTDSRLSPEALPADLWSNLANTPPGGPFSFGNPLLLTDGAVILHRTDTSEWYKLSPSITGSYVSGSWTQIAAMPAGYAPKFFASAVLPDGRVIAEGGEYNLGPEAFTTLGAIYDPSAGSAGGWTSIAPPLGWTYIGDAQSTVLSNKGFMLASCCDGNFPSAVLNPNGLNWTSTGAGKADRYDEEGWTLLPNGSVLTVDAYTTAIANVACGFNTEKYDPSSQSWSSAGNVPSQLPDCNDVNTEGGANPSFEIGPQVLLYNAKVIAFGGTTANVAHTSLYDTNSGSWFSGPDLPSECGSSSGAPCTLADAPATLLPNGNVLFVAGAGKFHVPSKFFEYNPNTNLFRPVPGTSDAAQIAPFYVNFVTLPTGQILVAETYTSTIQIYTPGGGVLDAARPIVIAVPSCVVRGSAYSVSGKQLNGLSQGSNYGDDQQAATNYPLVRIVNNRTGHVFYERTFDHSTMSIARNAPSSTHFAVAPATESGPGILYVVANGVPSTGTPINVSGTTCP